MCGVETSDVQLAVDGCGVPVHALPLYRLAQGYARMSLPTLFAPTRAAILRRITSAMTAHPEMVAGTDRICTQLMAAFGDRIFCKSGASAFYAVGIKDKGIGIALKMEDGASSIVPYAILSVLTQLGVITPEVEALLKEAGFPGMRVLQFAYGGDDTNMHLPENVGANMVLYTGTHDNDTAVGWWASAGAEEKAFARQKLGMRPDENDIADALIRAAYGSAALLCIIPMQDYLGLGTEARMNVPATLGGNWCWRMLPGAADAALAIIDHGVPEAANRFNGSHP